MITSIEQAVRITAKRIESGKLSAQPFNAILKKDESPFSTIAAAKRARKAAGLSVQSRIVPAVIGKGFRVVPAADEVFNPNHLPAAVKRYLNKIDMPFSAFMKVYRAYNG